MKTLYSSLLLLCLLATRGLGADPKGFQDLEAALRKLNNGITSYEQQSPDAQRLLNESAADLRSAIQTHQIHTPGAYHALGNAYMLLGELGHAVLAYKQGERIDPTDSKLKYALRHARQQVEVSVTPTPARRLTTLLMSWRGVVPRTVLWGVFLGCFSFAWLSLTARIAFNAPRWFITIALWMLGIAVLPLVALAAEWLLYMRTDQVVLIQNGAVARSGPDDSIYDPVYTQPLSAGVEATLLGVRDGWAHLELGNATKCWLPVETLEPVFPQAVSQMPQEFDQ